MKSASEACWADGLVGGCMEWMGGCSTVAGGAARSSTNANMSATAHTLLPVVQMADGQSVSGSVI